MKSGSEKNLSKLVNRRKALAIATVMGVAGCTVSSNGGSPITRAPDAEKNRLADTLVEIYTRDIETALDHVDRQRLDAARQAGKKPADLIKGEELREVAAGPLKSPTGDHGAAPAAHAPSPAPAAHAPARPEAPAKVEPAHAPAAAKSDPAAPVAAPASAIPVAVKAPAPQPVAAAAAHDDPLPPPAPAPAIKAPTVVPSAMGGVVIAKPADALPETILNPNLPAAAPPPSAMGSMTALLSPAPAASAVEHAPAAPAAEPSLEDALAVVRKNIATHPTLHTALALALLDGKMPEADVAKMLSDADQKVLADLVAALDTMKETPASSSAAPAQRAAPLVDAAKKWQQDAELTLPTLSLASRVDSYGVYTAVTPIFEQGRRHTVIVYCEVANFGSKKGDDGWYTTRLTQQESLITDDKLLVWRPNPEDVEDRSLNQRHDFYLVKKLTIPETLAAGNYTLRMDVTDTATGRRAVQSMEIKIVAR